MSGICMGDWRIIDLRATNEIIKPEQKTIRIPLDI